MKTDVIPFIKTIPERVEKELDKQKERKDNELVRLRKLQDMTNKGITMEESFKKDWVRSKLL